MLTIPSLPNLETKVASDLSLHWDVGVSRKLEASNTRGGFGVEVSLGVRQVTPLRTPSQNCLLLLLDFNLGTQPWAFVKVPLHQYL